MGNNLFSSAREQLTALLVGHLLGSPPYNLLTTNNFLLSCDCCLLHSSYLIIIILFYFFVREMEILIIIFPYSIHSFHLYMLKIEKNIYI